MEPYQILQQTMGDSAGDVSGQGRTRAAVRGGRPPGAHTPNRLGKIDKNHMGKKREAARDQRKSFFDKHELPKREDDEGRKAS